MHRRRDRLRKLFFIDLLGNFNHTAAAVVQRAAPLAILRAFYTERCATAVALLRREAIVAPGYAFSNAVLTAGGSVAAGACANDTVVRAIMNARIRISMYPT
jgi:hypothetical protein